LSGPEKLTACTKQLADIKDEKEKIEEKLKKNLSRELLIRRGLLTMLNLLHHILLQKTKT